MFAKWDWIIVALLVLAALVWELVRIRLIIRRDKAREKQDG